jgi:hypothetical protein
VPILAHFSSAVLQTSSRIFKNILAQNGEVVIAVLLMIFAARERCKLIVMLCELASSVL